MRIEHEHNHRGRRWSVTTSPAIDRALAGVLVVVTLGVAHLLGLDAVLLNLLPSKAW